MTQKQCCLLVLRHFDELERALSRLTEAEISWSEFSVLHKPRDDKEVDLFFRLPRIGGIICRGSFFENLADQLTSTIAGNVENPGRHAALHDTSEINGLAAALHSIGVPRRHHETYETALARDQILMISHGSESKVRDFCQALGTFGTFKPMLYLG